MAILEPFDANDVFASPEAARQADATVTALSLDAFRESVNQVEVQALLEAARALPVGVEVELPRSLT